MLCRDVANLCADTADSHPACSVGPLCPPRSPEQNPTVRRHWDLNPTPSAFSQPREHPVESMSSPHERTDRWSGEGSCAVSQKGHVDLVVYGPTNPRGCTAFILQLTWVLFSLKCNDEAPLRGPDVDFTLQWPRDTQPVGSDWQRAPFCTGQVGKGALPPSCREAALQPSCTRAATAGHGAGAAKAP